MNGFECAPELVKAGEAAALAAVPAIESWLKTPALRSVRIHESFA